jgi:hypothetical protein
MMEIQQENFQYVLQQFVTRLSSIEFELNWIESNENFNSNEFKPKSKSNGLFEFHSIKCLNLIASCIMQCHQYFHLNGT